MWLLLSACSPTLTNEDKSNKQDVASGWQIDFFDDFDSFNSDNWQDQILWVNNEDHCYVRDNQFNTREVSNGTLKLRVVDTGVKRPYRFQEPQGVCQRQMDCASKGRGQWPAWHVPCVVAAGCSE